MFKSGVALHRSYIVWFTYKLYILMLLYMVMLPTHYKANLFRIHGAALGGKDPFKYLENKFKNNCHVNVNKKRKLKSGIYTSGKTFSPKPQMYYLF